MLSLTNISSKGARKYYESAAGEYYEKESKSTEWQGQLAKELNLEGKIVNFDMFENLSNGKGLAGEKLVKSAGLEKHRAGIDLTFSAPKSVSLLSLEDSRLREAHQKAVVKTLEYIESNYIQTRTTEKGEKTIENTGKMIVAKFEHHTNRNQEPQLHTHSVIMNLTKDSKDHYKTIHNDKIYQDQKKIGQLYRLELAKNVIERGYVLNITDRKEGLFEISGVPNEILQEFSSRRSEVLKRSQELREEFKSASDAKIKEMAALDSRKAKGHELTKEEMEDKVNEVLSTFNTSLKDLHKNAQKSENRSEQKKQSADFYLKEAISGLEENQSAWKKADALDHAAKLSLGEHSILELEKGFQKLQQSHHILSLGNKNNNDYYSSQTMKNTEKNIVELVKSGLGQARIILQENEIEQTLSKMQKSLTPGQRQAVSHVLTSKDQIVGIQGDAGTGKTFVMEVIREILEDKGYKVRGFAPTGKAVLELAESAHIKSAQTIDSFLAPENEKKFSFKKQVWIIDETGMVGSKKMEKILQLANEKQAKVVIVGDSKQFQSIDQGKIFKDLQNLGVMSFTEMRDVFRQKTDETKEVVNLFNRYIRDGNNEMHIEKALSILKSSQSLVEVKNDQEKIRAITHEYADSLTKGKSTLIITNTNLDKGAINQEIRSELKNKNLIENHGISFNALTSIGLSGKDKMLAQNYQQGQVVFFQEKLPGISRGTQGHITGIDEKKNELIITYKGKSDFKSKTINLDLTKHQNSTKLQVFNREQKELVKGDKIIFGKNDSTLGIKNGQLGTVKDIDKKGNVTIKLAQKEVRINIASQGPKPYPYLDHAYAITEYKSQGATVDHLIWSTNSQSTNFQAGYVAVTRARESIKIYTDDAKKLEKNITKQGEKVSTLEFPYDFKNNKASSRSMEEKGLSR